MKRIFVLIATSILALQSVGAQDAPKLLWPIAGAKAGSNILATPQSYIDGQQNYGLLFVGAKQGTPVLAPADGTIKYVMVDFYPTITTVNSWGCETSFDDRIGEIRKDNSKQFDPKYITGSLTMALSDGRTININGLSGDKIFKTGQKIHRGDTIGRVEYSFKAFNTPSIRISIEKGGMLNDPMTPFGLKTTFVPAKKIEPILSMTPAQVKEDFLFFIEAVKECYPGLYDVVSGEKLDQYVSTTIQEIESSTADWPFVQVAILFNKTTSLIHDSHISWRGVPWDMSGAFKTPNQPQIEFGYIQGKYRCWNATTEYKHLIGRPIRSVNGMSADSMRKRMLQFICEYDGQVESYKDFILATQYYGLFLSPKAGSYDFNMRLEMDDTGEMIDVKAAPSRAKMVNDIFKFMRINRLKQGYKTTMLNDSTAYLGLSNFSLSQVAVDDIGRFVDSIERVKVPNLIVDVRNNGGGNDEVISKLYSYIAGKPFEIKGYAKVNSNTPYKTFARSLNRVAGDDMFSGYVAQQGKDGFYARSTKPQIIRPDSVVNYKGKVYVLINENSVSAATLFPAMLVRGHRGVVVGRETRTAYHFMNALKFVDIRMPNSMKTYTLPLVYCCFDDVVNDRVPYGRGVLPDYNVPITQNELLFTNGDAILNHALELIRTGKYLDPKNPFDEANNEKSK